MDRNRTYIARLFTSLLFLFSTLLISIPPIYQSPSPVQTLRKKIVNGMPTLDNKDKAILRNWYKTTSVYGRQSASVRTTRTLSVGEQTTLQKRLPSIKRSLERLIGMNLADNEIPKIAFCLSGGGCRAMLFSLGSLAGAEQIGLLDCSSHVISLSGSTWAVAGWLHNDEMPSDTLRKISSRLRKPLHNFSFDPSSLTDTLLKKVVFNQPISTIDLYGNALSQLFLDSINSRSYALLSEQAPVITQGTRPYPIYTAIINKPPQADWLEFTPHEIGNSSHGFIPTWAFGRIFRAGHTIDFAPEQSLGFLMGTWSSSIQTNAEQWNHIAQTLIKAPFLREALQQSFASELTELFLHVSVPDWSLAATQIKLIDIFDASIDSNIPIIPLLRRERCVDIICIIDASSSLPHSSLADMQSACDRLDLTLPDIDFDKADQSTCSVFFSPDYSIPTIIYIPLIKNEAYSSFNPQECLHSYCDTFNFVYTRQQAEELAGLGTFNVKSNRAKIVSAIRDTITKKQIQLSKNKKGNHRLLAKLGNKK